ncbi:unnamed protein product [Ceratitis capitata]|uniref:(Mediterranean fruit fly) hypothetical protein n=1 Tax=Ceratitis capitata TaxID=7213 RepID=A0A811VHJ1_CERCA|nr:unnamed protein product [Ceratitis capitata]
MAISVLTQPPANEVKSPTTPPPPPPPSPWALLTTPPLLYPLLSTESLLAKQKEANTALSRLQTPTNTAEFMPLTTCDVWVGVSVATDEEAAKQ